MWEEATSASTVTAFSGLEEGAFRLERFRGDRRAAEDYDTHEGLATHIRLGPDPG